MIHLRKENQPKRSEFIDSAFESDALGRGDLYAADQDQLLRWYRYLFLGRGKPSTHVRVLSGQTTQALAVGAPEELRALLASISARLNPPPPPPPVA